MSKWRRKYGTKKGENTGVDWDAGDVEGGERGVNGWGKRRKKRAHRAGLQGPIRSW